MSTCTQKGRTGNIVQQSVLIAVHCSRSHDGSVTEVFFYPDLTLSLRLVENRLGIFGGIEVRYVHKARYTRFCSNLGNSPCSNSLHVLKVEVPVRP